MTKIFRDRLAWFRQQVSEYQDALTRYSSSIVKSWEVAKEVVQEVFLRLWKQPDSLQEASLKVWLFKVCRHLCIDLLRKEGRMSPLLEDEQESLLCPKELPHEVLAKKEMHLCIVQKMATLPDHHQEVLRLKFQEDLSYQEISQVTGYPVNRVGVMIHRAVMNLRKSLAKEGGSHEA